MAVTATFLADWDQFNASTDAATARLRTVQGDSTKVDTSLKAMGASASMSASVLSGLAAQLAGMFTVGAVIQFGRSVLQAGDQIQKMADQTSLGTDEVQRLMYIAGQSGSSIESLVGAVQNLQQRLGDDSSGAAAAMKKLNINADAFNKLGTYEQMTLLAGAVKDIKDPTDQASVAAALFGKSWKEILPAIKAGMKETGDQATIMANDTVKALDRVGDTLTAAKGQATAWGGSVVTAIEGAGFAFGNFLSLFNPEHLGVSNVELLKLAKTINDPDGLKGALQKIPPHALAVSEALKAIPGKLPVDLEALNRAWEQDVVKMNAARDEAKRLAAEFEQTQKTVQMVEQSVRASRAAGLLGMLADEQKSSQQTFEAWLTAYEAIERAAAKQAAAAVAVAKEAAAEMTVTFIGVAKEVEAVVNKIKEFSFAGAAMPSSASLSAAAERPGSFLGNTTRTIAQMPGISGIPWQTANQSTVQNIYVTQPFGTPDAIGEAILARQRAQGTRFPGGV